MGGQVACSGGRRGLLSCSSSERAAGAVAATSSAPVSLHVYDICPSRLNDVLRPLGTGMFHCGVEVYFFEWTFCSVGDPITGSGIFCGPPRHSDHYDYRETLEMGRTAMSMNQVRSLLDRLHERWPADSYNTLRRNCCHFSDELCRMLGVGGIPQWTTNMAGTGAGLDANLRMMQRVMARGEPRLCCTAEEVAGDHEELDPIVESMPALPPRHCQSREGHTRADRGRASR